MQKGYTRNHSTIRPITFFFFFCGKFIFIQTKNVANLKYFGTTVTNQNFIRKGMKKRFISEIGWCHYVLNPLSSRLLSKNVQNYALKSPRTISHVSVELKTDVSEISVSIVRVDVVNGHTSAIHIPVLSNPWHAVRLSRVRRAEAHVQGGLLRTLYLNVWLKLIQPIL
jgi:hypothetical protein